jgi:acyl-CoA reductase-like NAD-dependent aldehyde dehydrogenase
LQRAFEDNLKLKKQEKNQSKIQNPKSKIQMLALTSIRDVIAQQRQFFATGKTKDLDFRLAQLKTLKQAILSNESQILAALKADLNKPELEGYYEIVSTIEEINCALKHLKSWAKPQKIKTSLQQFPASAWRSPEPLGVVLIIAPWNYPFSLLLSPLIGAIAAGNCAILKPSEIAPHTARLSAEIVGRAFEPNYIAAIEGGVETSQQLLQEKFDHIFFTGGTRIGQIVMEAAAKQLTPVTLELGGKSPCIVDADINLKEAAKRITWGKFLNAGQTCIAPDYLLVDSRIKSDLTAAIAQCLEEFYGSDPSQSPDYACIASVRHFERLAALLEGGEVLIGGQVDAGERYIAPTVIENVAPDSPLMQEEIFGPILPVLEYSNLEAAIAFINSRAKPLALYLFTNDRAKQAQVLATTSSGGVCLNDTIMQVGVIDLPFGGVGDSGIGSYHGKASFDTFSHYKSVLRRSLRFDLNWRYAPYRGKLERIKRLFKS